MLCNLAASEKVKVFIKPLKKSTTVTAEGKWGGGGGAGGTWSTVSLRRRIETDSVTAAPTSIRYSSNPMHFLARLRTAKVRKDPC